MIHYESISSPEGKTIKVRFEGHLDIAACNGVIAGITQLMSQEPTAKCIFIWDCSNMSSFDQMARKAWVNFMMKKRAQVRKIIVISDNLVVRGAARLMLKMFGLPATVLSKQVELEDGLSKQSIELAV